MDALQIVQFVQRSIKDRRGQILDLLEHGNVKSMEHYRELMGNLDALNHIAQELSGLLEQQEQIDD